MKKTILLLVGLCSTFVAMDQPLISTNFPLDPNLFLGKNYIEQGYNPSQQSNRVNIMQGGNVATQVIQNGSLGNVDVNQERYYGNDNFVNIRQFGTLNSVYSLQEGFNNRAVVGQSNGLIDINVGEYNTADIFQLGNDNSNIISQFGNMNFSSAGQLGTLNLLEVKQETNGGFVGLLQIGQANDARVNQVFGNSNTLNLVQYSGDAYYGNGYPVNGYPGNGYPGNGGNYPGNGYPGNGGNYPGNGRYGFGYVQEFLSQYAGIISNSNLPTGGIGMGNRFEINQSGELNSTDLTQIGSGNQLEISQEGFQNKITGLDGLYINNILGQTGLTGIQVGLDNYGKLRQTGSNNVIQYSQLGMGSRVDFEQNGNSNFARVNVSMNGMMYPN